jgi:4-methyl-5(b-hydroxyethyl)-thiazole monophosphate biosynthesis
MTRVLVPLAEGFEEIEAVTIIDLLRRAGIEVCIARAGPQPDASLSTRGAGTVTGSHGIAIQADAELADLDETGFEMIVLPGGMPGAAHLRDDARVVGMLRRASERGGYVAAICAAPSVLAHAGLLDGRAATSFPGFLDERSTPGLQLSAAPVVIDGRVITSRGPGTAIDFALTLIEMLAGGRVRGEIESRLQRPQPASLSA